MPFTLFGVYAFNLISKVFDNDAKPRCGYSRMYRLQSHYTGKEAMKLSVINREKFQDIWWSLL